MKNKKQTGSYYTPDILSTFLVKHIFNKYITNDYIKILEPSCGDGQFLKSLYNENVLNNKKAFIHINEMDEVELIKAIRIHNGKNNISLISSSLDYLHLQEILNIKYNLIIGNPPYIHKKYLSEQQLLKCKSINQKAGLSNAKTKNIWPAFLVSAIQLLEEDGILCYVLPAELLQVKYTKELREYLLINFEKIEIFAFNELIFPGIDQDVIVVIGIKRVAKTENKGISFYQVENLEDLKKPEYLEKHSNVHRKTLDKWTNYVLSDQELNFIDGIKKNLKSIKYYCERVEVGIVTAVNDFFIVDDIIAKKYDLKNYTKPILQKGSLVAELFKFTVEDLHKLAQQNKAINLIHIENQLFQALNEGALRYIKLGEAKDLHKGYKCSKRKDWYNVPSVWLSEGLFVKRSHLYPRIIVNEAKTYATDAFYRIKMKTEYKIEDLAFSFYNSLTLILAELEGRFYGGGVLELTPNEFKHLSIPFIPNISEQNYLILEEMFRNKYRIEEILKFTNSIILGHGLGLTDYEINQLDLIYKRLVARRLKTSNKKDVSSIGLRPTKIVY